MPKVFITGVAGFLGSHLADRFLKEGWEVAGCDSLVGGYSDNVPIGVKFHFVDCNHFDMMMDAVQGADVVYHCAATPYEGLSVFSPHIVTQNIVTATTGVLSAAVAVGGVRRFVQCSSMARYGTNEVPFRETMDSRPQDPYGIGKVAAEQLVRNLCEVHGMEWCVAVPHNIIGPRQKYDDPFRNVASIFINLMLQGRQPFVYGDGEQRRCFSFVGDVVEPLYRMAVAPEVVGQVINIGPDDRFITINELARIVAGLIGFDLNPIRMPGRPQEVKDANCSADKARDLLGYQPKIPLEDGLREMIAWIRARGTRPFLYHLPLEIENERTPRTWKERLF